MCCFYNTSNTINLVSATKYTALCVIEYCVFVKDLVDCSATTHGVIFAKYVAQIAKQQGRYAVGHGLSPLAIRSRLVVQRSCRSLPGFPRRKSIDLFIHGPFPSPSFLVF